MCCHSADSRVLRQKEKRKLTHRRFQNLLSTWEPLPEDRNLDSREDGTRAPGKEEDIQGT